MNGILPAPLVMPQAPVSDVRSLASARVGRARIREQAQEAAGQKRRAAREEALADELPPRHRTAVAFVALRSVDRAQLAFHFDQHG